MNYFCSAVFSFCRKIAPVVFHVTKTLSHMNMKSQVYTIKQANELLDNAREIARQKYLTFFYENVGDDNPSPRVSFRPGGFVGEKIGDGSNEALVLMYIRDSVYVQTGDGYDRVGGYIESAWYDNAHDEVMLDVIDAESGQKESILADTVDEAEKIVAFLNTYGNAGITA